MQRWIAVPVALVIAVAIQSSLLAYFPVLGAQPELALLVALAVAFEEGPEWGAISGFFAGLLIDLLGVIPLGISALSYSIVCYAVGSIGKHRIANQIQEIGIAGAATIVAQLIVLSLAFLIGQGTRGVTVVQILVTGVYNTLLATLVLPAMHWLLNLHGRRAQ